MNIYLMTKMRGSTVEDEQVFLVEDVAFMYITTKYPSYVTNDEDRGHGPSLDKPILFFDATRCNDDTHIYLKVLVVLTRTKKTVVDFVPLAT